MPSEVMKLSVKINEIAAMNGPDSIEYIPDDRQILIQTDGGNVVQDYGHISSGDKIIVNNLQFRMVDFLKIYELWQDRALVDFVDNNGIRWEKVRIKINKYSYNNSFKDIVNTSLEVWMI